MAVGRGQRLPAPAGRTLDGPERHDASTRTACIGISRTDGGGLIRSRFDDRVLLTSVDLADDQWAGGGEPAALDIDNGVFTVVTFTGREVLIKNP